mmetsp:Transcript_36754/g.72321  ORF Transcript_36754/g.72321 Transcript_36754/m.72321 type:complete len:189 (-) Transcript_36754:132-698(-)
MASRGGGIGGHSGGASFSLSRFASFPPFSLLFDCPSPSFPIFFCVLFPLKYIQPEITSEIHADRTERRRDARFCIHWRFAVRLGTFPLLCAAFCATTLWAHSCEMTQQVQQSASKTTDKETGRENPCKAVADCRLHTHKRLKGRPIVEDRKKRVNRNRTKTKVKMNPKGPNKTAIILSGYGSTRRRPP